MEQEPRILIVGDDAGPEERRLVELLNEFRTELRESGADIDVVLADSSHALHQKVLVIKNGMELVGFERALDKARKHEQEYSIRRMIDDIGPFYCEPKAEEEPVDGVDSIQRKIGPPKHHKQQLTMQAKFRQQNLRAVRPPQLRPTRRGGR